MADILFAPEAVASANAFRQVLNCMSKPGHVSKLEPYSDAPVPLFGTTAMLLTTLCDFQSAIWLSEECSNPAVLDHLKFHTGAPIVKEPAKAGFAIASARSGLPFLSRFSPGTHEYPDRSTTVVIQVDGFESEGVVLSGPGLKHPTSFGASPLKPKFWLEMIVNHRQYPLGVDVIFASPSHIACCPRSTAIFLQETG
jgi:alpha-D-ribose 1-methylphosphonate 5-triphosphate synthase subunit PhnH